jgi:copper homeostasis protein
MIIREACVESFQEALRAQQLGAERIELCSRLDLGGITPSYALIQSVINVLNIPVMVMIRPRGGNFIYNAMEFKIIRQNIETCKTIGVAGVVFGFLDESRAIDKKNTNEMVRIAHPLEVTFHKAIDDTPDPVAAVKDLTGIGGITRLLSSGGAETAMEGANVLKEMISKAENNIIVMPGGKVTKDNLEDIVREINAREFHGRKIVGTLSG